jgi:multidrug efflux pump subunit AcrA (membrane-fusion protein)
MNVSNASLRTYGILAVALVALTALGAFVYSRLGDRQPPAKQDERTTQREVKGVKFKRPEHARLRGIEAEGVKSAQWRPKLHIDGRVVPNPHATLEIRAPFAGILRIDAAESKLRLGAAVAPHDTLALFDARFTPTESLDLKTKLVEADARHKSAEEVVKIRQERLGRLNRLQVGVLSQDDVDSASVQLSEARMQANIALTQYAIWKQALESVGKKTVVVPIQSPITGEIAEVGVQPGANVDAGQMIARIVDFRRVLLRLDFPTTATSDKPPASVHVKALDSPDEWRAGLRGRASNLEPGLQKASWFYEIVPDDKGASPRWQAGLYARASLDDMSKPAEPAIAIPASALLVHQGRTLVYTEKRPDRYVRYERREVTVLGRDGDTLYIAAEGWLASEDRVVISGAQVLLSEEFRSEVDED